jgi:hypothetical protein
MVSTVIPRALVARTLLRWIPQALHVSNTCFVDGLGCYLYGDVDRLVVRLRIFCRCSVVTSTLVLIYPLHLLRRRGLGVSLHGHVNRLRLTIGPSRQYRQDIIKEHIL